MPPLVRSVSVSIFGKSEFQHVYSFNHKHFLEYPWRFGEVNFVVSYTLSREISRSKGMVPHVQSLTNLIDLKNKKYFWSNSHFFSWFQLPKWYHYLCLGGRLAHKSTAKLFAKPSLFVYLCYSLSIKPVGPIIKC